MRNDNGLEALLQRLRGAVEEGTLRRLTPALESLLEQFELVPRRELQGYLRTLAELENLVTDLEQRVAQLEGRGTTP